MLYEDEIPNNTRVYSANTKHPPYLQHSVSSINPEHHISFLYSIIYKNP